MADRQDAPAGTISASGVGGSDFAGATGMALHWARNLPFGRALLYLFSAAVFLYLIAPVFIVIPISFSDYKFLQFPPDKWSLRWYENYFTSSKWINSTIDSAIVAPLVVAFSVPLGVLGAYSLVRGRYPGKNLVSALTIFPLIVPQLVTAVAIYFLYVKLNLIGTVLGFVLAHSVLAFPFTVVIMTAALRGIDETLERAAMSCGARRLTVLWRITLPLAMPGIVTSAFFSFLISFDELLVAMFIGTARFNTLPKRMWNSVRAEVDPTIAVVATLMIVMTIVIICLAAFIGHRIKKRTTGIS